MTEGGTLRRLTEGVDFYSKFLRSFEFFTKPLRVVAVEDGAGVEERFASSIQLSSAISDDMFDVKYCSSGGCGAR
jgi:hypothetical protein